MKKYIAFFLSLIIFVGIAFSGCSLVEINEAQFWNQTIASVNIDDDTTINVNMEEFYTSYSNYIETYTESYGYTQSKAVDAILQGVINRKVLVYYIKNEPAKLVGASDVSALTLNQNDYNDVWEEVFDYVDEQLVDYISDVETDWDITISNESDDEDEDNSDYIKDEYSPTYKVVNGQLVKIIEETSTYIEDAVVNPYKSYFWFSSDSSSTGYTTTGSVKTKLTTYSNGIKEEALSRWIKDLKSAESYKNYSDNTYWDVFNRELERVYQIQLDNAYVQKLEDWFDDKSTYTVDEVVNYYKYQIESQMETYADSSNLYEVFNTAMKSDATSIYYYPTNSWFYVSHVLIGYSDEQLALIEEWETELTQGYISQAVYDSNVSIIQSQIVGEARDSEGNLTGETKSASSILIEIEDALAQVGNDTVARAKIFDEFNYKYSTDTAFFNLDFDYAIPADSDYDSMVTEFADESRVLRSEGLTSISELVYTEYGAHIIMYTGETSNLVNNINSVTINNLASKTLKLSSDKTYLDLVIGKLTEKEYSTYQAQRVNELKSDATIKIYKSKISAFYNAE